MSAGDNPQFVRKCPKSEPGRLAANSQKRAIRGPFCEDRGQFIRARDCVAGAGGFEPRPKLSANPLIYCAICTPHPILVYSCVIQIASLKISRVSRRSSDRFKPERLVGDTAYGAAPMLNWLVEEKGIAPSLCSITYR